jgi:segregation and condensation protein A
LYKIKLPNFEGPFDLLLYFIRRDEINIYDIPIARITQEFLKYIRMIQFFDLEMAAEFIAMASLLLYIKTQMLLPKDESEVSDSEDNDPRTELVKRLLEYKQFKEAAANLYEFSEQQRYIFYRQLFDGDSKILDPNLNATYKNATIFDLMQTFKKLIEKKIIEEDFHLVDLIPATVEEKREQILNDLSTKKRIKFFDLVKGCARIDLIVTFLAILELMKLNNISIRQHDLFEEIIIYKIPKFIVN